jgi:membrane-associated phospholipid phosphatase
MNTWLEGGIPIIVTLQSLGDWLIAPMHLFSLLGSEYFYLLVMPIVVWCIDAGLGLRMGWVLLTSATVNNILKLAIGWPRPYWVSEQVRALAHETSFGMPSGHSQGAVAMWGVMAIVLRRLGWVIAAVCLVLLISISRMYLGVHFPADVLGGWAAGALLLVLFAALEKPIERWLLRQRLGVQLATAALFSLGLVAVASAVASATADRVIPTAWIAAAAAAQPGAPIDPQRVDGAISNAGALLGLGVGAVLLHRMGTFQAGGPIGQRALRFALGLAGVLVLYVGLSALTPHGQDVFSQVFRYLRYAAVGIWVSYLAPWLFVRLKLA